MITSHMLHLTGSVGESPLCHGNGAAADPVSVSAAATAAATTTMSMESHVGLPPEMPRSISQRYVTTNQMMSAAAAAAQTPYTRTYHRFVSDTSVVGGGGTLGGKGLPHRPSLRQQHGTLMTSHTPQLIARTLEHDRATAAAGWRHSHHLMKHEISMATSQQLHPGSIGGGDVTSELYDVQCEKKHVTIEEDGGDVKKLKMKKCENRDTNSNVVVVNGNGGNNNNNSEGGGEVAPSQRSRKLKYYCCLFVVIATVATCSLLVIVLSSHRGSGPGRQDSTALQAEMQRARNCSAALGNSSGAQACNSEECYVGMGSMLQKMNLRINPCQDFYQYSCGGWIKNSQIPITRDQIGASSDVIMSTDDALFGLLVEAEEENLKNQTQAEQKMIKFFASCHGMQEIETLKFQPLLHLIDSKFDGWKALASSKKRGENQRDVDTYIYRCLMLNIGCLVNIDVITSEPAADGYDILISTNHVLTLQDSNFYFETIFRYEKFKQDMKNMMTEIFDLIGVDGRDDVIDDVYDFEQNLAQIMPRNDVVASSMGNYTQTTIRHLAEICPEINWLRMVSKLIPKLHVSDSTLVKVKDLETFFAKLSVLMQTTSKRTLHNYFIWRVIHQFGHRLSYKFKQVYRKYFTNYGYRIRSPYSNYVQELMNECFQLVKTHFKLPLGMMYVRKFFSKEMKSQVEDIAKVVKSEIYEQIKRNEWLNIKSRNYLLNRLNQLEINIGYDDGVQPAILNNLYSFPVLSKQFFKNYVATIEWEKKQQIDRLTTSYPTTNYNKWPIPFYVTSVIYYREQNSMFLPAAFLQPPFYYPKGSREANYGTVGSTIAHEMSHAFDILSAQVIKGSWFDEFANNFTEKAQCVVNHYNEYPEISGERTLFENLADLNGVLVSYLAFKRGDVAKTKSPNKILGFTKDQIFFVKFAQTYCTKQRRAKSKRKKLQLLLNNLHSPQYYRVVETLSNVPQFSETFNCPAQSRMNRRDKCSIW